MEEEIRILTNCQPGRVRTVPVYTEEAAENAYRFHQSIPEYRETELVSLNAAAAKYRVGDILVKDESSRLGLKAFKGLGGSYAMFRLLCEKFSLDERQTDFKDFQREEILKKCREIVFVTATDGNHGKGISWAAKMFGCKARVFMPAGSAEARRAAIESAGSASAEITKYNYDRTVKYAAMLAKENGWILIQDTAWEGYEKIPRWIVEGYLTMAREIVAQMGKVQPTHIFLQAGVGAMAGGIAEYFLWHCREKPPLITIVEPEEAACVFRSAAAADGNAHSVDGELKTIMAGLNCGTPCKITWPILRDGVSFFCACRDSVAELGMRAYANPEKGDKSVVSGESGAVSYGLLLSILREEHLRRKFRIGRDSVILLINTEGDTDPVGYRRVVC